MKTCTKCQTIYNVPLENFFHKKSDTKDGLQRQCKKCVALFHKEHYKQRKNYYKHKASIHNDKYKKRNQTFILDYLSKNPCVDCGEDNILILEFDHRKNKLYNISKMLTLSLKLIKKEIAKCDVRCANCHRIKTAIQFNYYNDFDKTTFNKLIKLYIEIKEKDLTIYESNIRYAQKVIDDKITLDGKPYIGNVSDLRDGQVKVQKRIKAINNQIAILKKLFKD